MNRNSCYAKIDLQSWGVALLVLMYATQKKLFYSSLDSTFRDLSILSWLFKGPMVVVKRAQLLLFVVSDSTFQKLREAQIHTVNCRQGIKVILEKITKFNLLRRPQRFGLIFLEFALLL